jgi:hypothetical protein
MNTITYTPHVQATREFIAAKRRLRDVVSTTHARQARKQAALEALFAAAFGTLGVVVGALIATAI